jgi:lysophospholipase L1-like esterase
LKSYVSIYFPENIKMKFILLVTALLLQFIVTASASAQDWAELNRYQTENEKIMNAAKGEKRIVFMGDSITDEWTKKSPSFFKDKAYINRGISGQVTAQMLVRMRSDVINLKPAVMVLLCGTNDIAENLGPVSLETILGNIVSMVELAKANEIKVVLSSVLPVFEYPWKKQVKPVEKIAQLNTMIKTYADKNGIAYIDYYAEMMDERNGLKAAYTYDGVHPNEAGYQIMGPLAEKAIRQLER